MRKTQVELRVYSEGEICTFYASCMLKHMFSYIHVLAIVVVVVLKCMYSCSRQSVSSVRPVNRVQHLRINKISKIRKFNGTKETYRKRQFSENDNQKMLK